MRRHDRGHCGSGPAPYVHTPLGPECAARAALVARPLTPPGSACSAIRRIVEFSNARVDFDDATATKFLMYPMFSS
jgi:hypothetical protein